MTFVDAQLAPARKTGHIKLHGPEAFEGMRKAGRLTAEALDMLTDFVKPGVSTDKLDRMAFDFAMDHKAYPAPLGYRGYRKSVCTSINHVVCHGIPDAKPLRDGDIVNVDVTLLLDGWHGDSSRMYCVGQANRRAERLIEVTYESLMRGIDALAPHRAGMLRLIGDMRTDGVLAGALAPILHRSMKRFLDAAELDASGIQGNIRAAGLTGVWFMTIRAWEGDASQDMGPTMAALDRALDRAEQTARSLRLEPGDLAVPPVTDML